MLVWGELEQRFSWILPELETAAGHSTEPSRKGSGKEDQVTQAIGFVEQLGFHLKRLKKKWYLSEL